MQQQCSNLLPPSFSIDGLNEVLYKLAEAGCSDITLETKKPVWASLHGNKFRVTERELQDYELQSVANWMYGNNATAQIGSGKPVDTRYTVKRDRHSRFYFRMNGVGCSTSGGDGISISLRSIPARIPDLEEMEFPKELAANLFHQKGLVLVVGETGSGKSTALAASLGHLARNYPNRKIVTYEDPIEFNLQDVNGPSSFISQRQVGTHVDSFYQGIVNALRQAPTDILIGEARDKETIGAMINAAETGHVTYATVHAESVATALLRVANEFPPDQLAQTVFKLVAQLRLVMVQRLAMPAEAGAKRVPIREWLVFTDEIRRDLMRMDAIKAVNMVGDLVREAGQSMAQQARNAFKAGQISLETLKTFVGDDA